MAVSLWASPLWVMFTFGPTDPGVPGAAGADVWPPRTGAVVQAAFLPPCPVAPAGQAVALTAHSDARASVASANDRAEPFLMPSPFSDRRADYPRRAPS